MNTRRRTLLRAGATLSLSALPLAALALPVEFGPVKGTLDTTVSLGASFRTQEADPSLIGIANGGTSRSVNDDDGNYGFDQMDPIGTVAKASHDLELKRGDFGMFSRLTYFFDQTASQTNEIGGRLNTAGRVVRGRDRGVFELGQFGNDRLGSEIQLLDLYAYGSVDIGGRKLTARAGRQAINWGETTFIANGINVINPIDVARFRAPGAELKEALMPTMIVSLSYPLLDNLSTEVIWMAGWDPTRIDPRQSFFSTNDFVSDDGNKAVVGFGRRNDDNRVSDPVGAPGSASAYLTRERTRSPDNTLEQWGANLRYFADIAGGTEFGLFYLKYHSRTPLVSAVRGGATSPFGPAQAPNGNAFAPTCSQSAVTGCRGTYFSEYPENIELFGASFNLTLLGETAVQGEYSYRPNQPLQLAGTEVLLTALGVPSTVAATPPPLGSYIQGWRDVAMHQAQVTLTHAFGPTLAAEQFVMVGEVGYNFLDQPDGLKFNGPGAGLPSCAAFRNLPAGNQAAVSNGSCQEAVGGGYGTRHSWGYRLVSRMDFENAIGAVQASPRIALAHDVTGVGPNFNHGTKAATLGIGFNYLQRYTADIGYTTFFGGRTYAGTDTVAPGTVLNPQTGARAPGDASQSRSFATSANPNKDRDFVAVSVSYAF